MDSKLSNLVLLYKITPETLKKFEENAVYLKKPRLVAYYEHLDGHIVDANTIKYFKNPQPALYPINLNCGFREYVTHRAVDYSKQIWPTIKCYLSLDADVDDDCRNMEKTKVITRRGTLVRIMELYYNRFYTDLAIRVTRYNGTLYMILEQSEPSDSEFKPVNTHHKNFEQFLFSESPDDDNNPPKAYQPINENFYQIGVHRSSLGKYDIFYSGDMQGIISNKEIKDFDMAELNDCRFVFTKQMWKSYKTQDQKYFRMWLQSYLANVQDIYVGYKNAKGVIEEPIEHKKSGQLAKDRYWKPAVCTGFLHEFLKNIEKCMSSVNCSNTVYIFHYDQDEKSISYEIFNGKTDKTFITDI